MIKLIFSITYRKKLFDKEKKIKFKHSTLYYGYENGGIKNVDLKKQDNKYGMFLGKKIV